MAIACQAPSAILRQPTYSRIGRDRPQPGARPPKRTKPPSGRASGAIRPKSEPPGCRLTSAERDRRPRTRPARGCVRSRPRGRGRSGDPLESESIPQGQGRRDTRDNRETSPAGDPPSVQALDAARGRSSCGPGRPLISQTTRESRTTERDERETRRGRRPERPTSSRTTSQHLDMWRDDEGCVRRGAPTGGRACNPPSSSRRCVGRDAGQPGQNCHNCGGFVQFSSGWAGLSGVWQGRADRMPRRGAPGGRFVPAPARVARVGGLAIPPTNAERFLETASKEAVICLSSVSLCESEPVSVW